MNRLSRSVDYRNIAFILVCCLLVAIVVSPLRTFPINDDWAYARAVQDAMSGKLHTPDWAQATALSNVAWGVLFSISLGFSFTALSVSNLVASAACLVLFYALLRYFEISPGLSCLGVAVLGTLPTYVYLSYTFMTDIWFLALFLAACLCFLRAFKTSTNALAWLTAGGALSSLAFLTRQFGIIIALAALVYIWITTEGWQRYSRAAATMAVPVLAVVWFSVWKQSEPPQLVDTFTANMLGAYIRHPLGYAINRLLEVAQATIIPGLWLLPLARKARKPILVLELWITFALLIILAMVYYGGVLLPSGNILDSTGYIMYGYNRTSLGPMWVWLVLGLVGALGASLALASSLDVSSSNARVPDRLSTVIGGLKHGGYPLRPGAFLYILVPILAVATIIPTVQVFDRYLLPLVALAIIALLRGRMRQPEHAPRRGWTQATVLSSILVSGLGLLAVAGEHDYLARAQARWNAAEELRIAGVPAHNIEAGFEWEGWYVYPDAIAYASSHVAPADILAFPTPLLMDPEYVLAEQSRVGYINVKSVPYHTWLPYPGPSSVLVLRRTDTAIH